MGSLKMQTLLLAYILVAVLLHPCLCQDLGNSPTAGARTMDGKAIDQGIAYMLMLIALLVTYIVH